MGGEAESTPAPRIGVLQITDSLQIGGAERMAVNLANHLPRTRFDVHLCSTREEGDLADVVADDVSRLRLDRRTRIDEPAAALRLARYARKHRIRILHCHKDTIFLAALAAPLLPGTILVWHVHTGEFAFRPPSPWLYRAGNWRTHGVIAVNEPLVAWAVKALHFSADRAWYVPNFVLEHAAGELAAELPGTPGRRIVNVANLLRQKDQVNLVRAMSRVVRKVPDAQLLLVGRADSDYAQLVRAEIAELGMEEHVSILGSRGDVSAILSNCDVGVLGSESEGLPLSLIEYGMAGLPSVATRVGQCADVLADGAAGLLVPRRDPDALARGLLHLLQSKDRRDELAKTFRRHAEMNYGPETGIRRVCAVYDALLAR